MEELDNIVAEKRLGGMLMSKLENTYKIVAPRIKDAEVSTTMKILGEKHETHEAIAKMKVLIESLGDRDCMSVFSMYTC